MVFKKKQTGIIIPGFFLFYMASQPFPEISKQSFSHFKKQLFSRHFKKCSTSFTREKFLAVICPRQFINTETRGIFCQCIYCSSKMDSGHVLHGKRCLKEEESGILKNFYTPEVGSSISKIFLLGAFQETTGRGNTKSRASLEAVPPHPLFSMCAPCPHVLLFLYFHFFSVIYFYKLFF